MHLNLARFRAADSARSTHSHGLLTSQIVYRNLSKHVKTTCGFVNITRKAKIARRKVFFQPKLQVFPHSERFWILNFALNFQSPWGKKSDQKIFFASKNCEHFKAKFLSLIASNCTRFLMLVETPFWTSLLMFQKEHTDQVTVQMIPNHAHLLISGKHVLQADIAYKRICIITLWRRHS